MLPNILRRNRMPGLLDEFFGTDWLSDNFTRDINPTIPAVNIIEDNKEYRIEVAIPGIDKKDVKIDLHNNILSICSEKKEDSETKEDNYMRHEFHYSSFKRSFTLPDNTDTEKIKAKQNDGILTVSIPKKPEAVEKGPKQISIT